MNNFDNVDLTYYGEDIYIANNVKYHDVQNKIKKYLEYLVNTIETNEIDTKSYNAKEFVQDLKYVINNMGNVRSYDGRTNKISITDKFIHFDYVKKDKDNVFFEEVVIDKLNNEFYFIKTNEDIFINVTEYSFEKTGINKINYNDVAPLFMFDDDSIEQSLYELKNDSYKNRMAI